MRKQFKLTILASLLSVLSLNTVNAQSAFKKSDKIVEGTVSYTKTTDVDAVWSLNPTVGYFLTDKIAVGLSGQLGGDGKTTTTNVGVFGRYYLLTLCKNILVYSQLDATSNSTKVSGKSTTSFTSNIGLGANYFLTQKLALTMGLTNLVSYESKDSKSTFSVGFDGINNPLSTAKFGLLYRF